MILFKIGFVLIIFLIVFHFATRKYINPYKLYMVFGKKGSGKSTLMVRLALSHINKGWSVYCSEHINVPGVRYFNINQIGRKTFDSNSLVLIDEVGMIWDNRDFKNFANDVRDWFKLQRHYKCKVYLFSQSFDIDKKLRDLTDGLYLCSTKLRVITWAKRIHRSITLTSSEADRESRIAEDLVFDSLLAWPFGSRILTWIPKYAKYFDSHVVKPLPPVIYDEVPNSPINDTKTKRLFCCVTGFIDHCMISFGVQLQRFINAVPVLLSSAKARILPLIRMVGAGTVRLMSRVVTLFSRLIKKNQAP